LDLQDCVNRKYKTRIDWPKAWYEWR
jgi:hypothetical protein